LASPEEEGHATAALRQVDKWARQDPQGGVIDALAAGGVLARLAAWAAAALRAGREDALGALREPLDSILRMAWSQGAAASSGPDFWAGAEGDRGAADEALTQRRQRPAPGFDVVMRGNDGARTAADYERIATEALSPARAAPPAPRGAALAAARALATRPCANPRCIKIVGCRERDAVGRRCTGCMMSRYCCRECQVAAWRAHKGVCGELRAEREAGEAA
jgi:hypothetical protein